MHQRLSDRLTLISISLCGATVSISGVILNSLGVVSLELPPSLMLLSTRLSPWNVASSRMHPSAGTRRLKVIGMSDVLTKVKVLVWTNPVTDSSNQQSIISTKMGVWGIKILQGKLPGQSHTIV